MSENSVNILDILGSHFKDAVSEPGEVLKNIKSDLEGLYTSERYEYIRDVAEGGLKKVTLEKDLVTKREVAVSSLKAEQTEEEVLRFINEAYLTARLEHNNIVPLHDFGYRDQKFFFTTKFLDGEDFQSHLKKGFGLRKNLEVFVDICQGISYAHSKGVVHLDLKPSNVQVSEHGEVIIFDWGLARDLLSEDSLDSFFDEKFAGSPGFTAPEQIRCDNEQINEQTDIYSLGSILFQILTGRIPWKSTNSEEVIKKTLSGDQQLLNQELIN